MVYIRTSPAAGCHTALQCGFLPFVLGFSWETEDFDTAAARLAGLDLDLSMIAFSGGPYNLLP
jgi:hypothetical protein